MRRLVASVLIGAVLCGLTAQAVEDVQELLKARDQAMAKAMAAASRLRDAGISVDPAGFREARSERDKQLAVAKNPQEKLDACKRYASAMKQLERRLRAEVTTGRRAAAFADIARFHRLQAEVELAEAGGGLPDVKRDRILIDSYERTLAALQAERAKLRAGKSTLFVVLQLADDLRDFEVQMADTRSQRIAALARYVGLLQELQAASLTELDRTMVRKAIEKAEADLVQAKGDRKVD